MNLHPSRTIKVQSATEDGFTLLETLIAFMILALSLGIFVQSIGLASSQTASADRLLQAERLGQLLLAEQSFQSAAGETAGSDADTGLVWRNVRDLKTLTAANGTQVPFLLLTVEVGAKGNESPLLVLKTVRVLEITP